MPGTSTQFKLGVFTLVGLAALVAIAIVLGVRGLRSQTVRYHTYFDESAQGLDVGSPVKYRGVRIGSVAKISIAPDLRWVDVELAIDRDAAKRLQLARPPRGLRTQLALQGITGVKFIDMDFVDPTTPLPDLGFPPAHNYIPSRPSLFKGLEGRIGGVTRELPDLIDSTKRTLDRVGDMIDEAHEQRLAQRAGAVLDNLQSASNDLEHWTRELRRAGLPEQTAGTLQRIDAAAAKLDRTLDRFAGTDALIASAKRMTEQLTEVGRRARGSTRELTQTLDDLSEAARTIRRFFDELEREPDMLVKGRARRR
ncbi:MAG TPA: MlaD family protein [Kofleriaceae bacterium]|nr:MlaD family protein [Kofleriaceae bacterium]